jgi:hypothetical protein
VLRKHAIPSRAFLLTNLISYRVTKYKGKGKAKPLQALTGLEGSRRLMIPDFKTIGT